MFSFFNPISHFGRKLNRIKFFIPSIQYTPGIDCNDANALTWRNRYADADADTYGAGSAGGNGTNFAYGGGGGGGGGSSFSSGTSTTYTSGYQAGAGQVIITYTPASTVCTGATCP